MEIKLNLTDQQAKNLEDVLSEYEDCGPRDERWQSDKIIELYELVKAARNESYRWAEEE